MELITAFGLYVLLIITVIFAVLFICLSKTLSVNEFKIMFQKVYISVSKNTEDDKNDDVAPVNENKYLPRQRIAFSQNPLSGVNSELEFKNEFEPMLIQEEECIIIYEKIVEDCIGMWNRIDDKECTLLMDKLEQKCILEPVE